MKMGITNHNHEIIHDQKTTFLPMFCRLSIKDVKLSAAPISAAADPSSPTVSCIGQVKRSNRVTAFPSAAPHHHHKHTKPRKVHFSTKALLPNPPAATTAAVSAGGGGRKSASRSRGSNREMCTRDSRRSVEAVIDISKMDPPLPVVNRAAPPGYGRDEVNIWRRRSMQIEPIHLPVRRFQPPATTV